MDHHVIGGLGESVVGIGDDWRGHARFEHRRVRRFPQGGQHVAQVKSKVPDDQWCPGHARQPSEGGWFKRLLGR